MNRTVSLSIGRCSDGRIRLTLEDGASGVQFCELDLAAADWGNAVTGLETTCGATLRGLERIGTRHEYKHEEITQPEERPLRRGRPQYARSLLAPFEQDGWMGRAEGIFNEHNFLRNTPEGPVYRIGFDRWVPDSDKGD